MKEELGLRFRAICNFLSIQQGMFAKRIGITPGGFDKILAGDSLPSYKTFIKIKKAYPEIDLNWLLAGVGEMIDYKQKALVLNDGETKYLVRKCDNEYCTEEKQQLRRENLVLKKELLETSLLLEDHSESEKKEIKAKIKTIKKELF